jgi:hypothetical protein
LERTYQTDSNPGSRGQRSFRAQHQIDSKATIEIYARGINTNHHVPNDKALNPFYLKKHYISVCSVQHNGLFTSYQQQNKTDTHAIAQNLLDIQNDLIDGLHPIYMGITGPLPKRSPFIGSFPTQ